MFLHKHGINFDLKKHIPRVTSTFGSDLSAMILYDTKQLTFVYLTLGMVTMYRKSLQI